MFWYELGLKLKKKLLPKKIQEFLIFKDLNNSNT
jgi:hypothetical protein